MGWSPIINNINNYEFVDGIIKEHIYNDVLKMWVETFTLYKDQESMVLIESRLKNELQVGMRIHGLVPQICIVCGNLQVTLVEE